MKNNNRIVRILKSSLLTSLTAGLIGVGAFVSSYSTQAQVVNFDSPGGIGGANYSGQGAFDDSANNTNWNPIAKGGTTPAATESDGVTISPITMTDNSPSSYNPGGQGAAGTPAGLECPFLLENNGSEVAETLNNVPPGTYDLYLYGKNDDVGDGNRGATFTVSTDLKSPVSLSTDCSITTNFVQGNDYVLFKSVVVGPGQTINFSYTANTNVIAGPDHTFSSTGTVNHEGDFNGVQLVFVSSSTNLPPDTLELNDIYPNGATLFQPASTLSFNAVSLAGIDPSGVSVQITGTNINGATGYSAYLTADAGLTITAGSTNLTASAPLTNGFFYTVSIQVVDLNGYVTNRTFVFNTINPASVYTFEAEDYDYGGGKFIDNPQTNAYAGAGHDAVQGVDVNDPNNASEEQAYGRTGLETQPTTDIPRAAYIGTSDTDYDVGDNNNGNWANYTRTYPHGPYIIYLRATSQTGSSDSATLSVESGGNLTTLGTFSVPATNDLQQYAWVPLLNANGQPAIFSSAGDVPETLQTRVANGGYNANFFMLVSVNTNFVNLANIYPNGTNQFQATNVFSFTINASDEVASTNILVSMAETNLLGQSFTNNLTGSGLSITGPANSQTVSIPIETNMLYGVTVEVTDASGIMVTTNESFDTVTPAYTFEAEDFNYDGGLWADPFKDGNIDEFAGATAELYIDDYDQLVASGKAENTDAYGRGGIDTEDCGDKPRLSYLEADSGEGAQDFDCGNATTGNWADYTRIYPAGTYNVFMRAATPNAIVADAMSLSIVTNGLDTSNQTMTVVGTFAVPTTGGWQTYTWVPLTDNGGQAAQVVFDGSTTVTLRATWDNSGFNANYFMLMPANTTLPVISDLYPNGQYQFQNTGNFSFKAESSAGFNDSGISVLLTGTNLLGQVISTNYTSANGLIFSGSGTNLSVSLPLTSNVVYSATITVTTENNETATSTVTFDTVVPGYIFEAEDFNFGGGQFINPPETNAYLDLSAVIGIDAESFNYNTNSQMVYRTNGLNVEVTGDVPRSPYDNTGFSDYDVGNNGTGDWADYTREFPAGIYNIYMRGANGANSNQVDAASMDWITSGAATTNQVAVPLGTFSVPGSGWQSYSDVPLIDTDGNYAQFVSGGTETLRVVTDGGDYNANYYFLMPAETTLPVNPPKLKAAVGGSGLVVSFLSRTNTTYQLLFKANLTDASWTPMGSALSGNSFTESITNEAGGDSGFYRLQTTGQ
jgi:hypothetical protein